MRHKPRRRWIAALLVAAVLGGGLYWRFRRHETRLLVLAHAVMRVDPEYTSISWLSVERGLAVHTLPQATSGNASLPQGKWQCTIDAFPETGKASQAGLARCVNASVANGIIDRFRASPDGGWVVWVSYGFADHCMLNLARPDGTHYRSWKIETDRYEGYFPDSHHFVLVRSKTPRVAINDLDDPSRDRTSLTAAEEEAALAAYYAREPTFVRADVADMKEASVDENFAIYEYRTEDRPHVQNAGREPPREPLHTYKIPAPRESMLLDTGVSPHQQAVFYHIYRQELPVPLAWMHTRFPALGIKFSNTEALWVSRRDGTDLHEVGHFVIDSKFRQGVDNMYDIQWMPDDKHLSFIYHNTLYTVSADPE